MKWFVITLCLAFLFTSLFIDVWKYFVGASYRNGLGVVPILLAANVCLGIYYNLSVWYKIRDKMHMGMLITLVGAVVTLVLNFAFIPAYGMYACAWAMLAAYGSMMVISYFMGQKIFPGTVCGKKADLLYSSYAVAVFCRAGRYAFYGHCHHQAVHGGCLYVPVFISSVFGGEKRTG